MGRTTIYRTDVEKARKALLARGINPSIDAVRVELGNTGSKSTIHRYLKEIEADEGASVGAKLPISDQLADLVGRLAERLTEEADEKVTQAKERFEAQLSARDGELQREKSAVVELSVRLERSETALDGEKAAHVATREALAEAQTTVRQLEERIAGLDTRIQEHERHARSLETKHEQAREAPRGV
jgi:chromosome segregation ATPase